MIPQPGNATTNDSVLSSKGDRDQNVGRGIKIMKAPQRNRLCRAFRCCIGRKIIVLGLILSLPTNCSKRACQSRTEEQHTRRLGHWRELPTDFPSREKIRVDVEIRLTGEHASKEIRLRLSHRSPVSSDESRVVGSCKRHVKCLRVRSGRNT